MYRAQIRLSRSGEPVAQPHCRSGVGGRSPKAIVLLNPSVTDANLIFIGEFPSGPTTAMSPVSWPTPDLQWGWATGSPDLDSLIWARYIAPPDTIPGGLANDEANVPCPFPAYFQPPRSPPSKCDVYHMWSFHTGGANFALGDGSVRFFNYAAGTRTIIDMSTRAGGEVLSE